MTDPATSSWSSPRVLHPKLPLRTYDTQKAGCDSGYGTSPGCASHRYSTTVIESPCERVATAIIRSFYRRVCAATNGPGDDDMQYSRPRKTHRIALTNGMSGTAEKDIEEGWVGRARALRPLLEAAAPRIDAACALPDDVL